jgi:uncharacterized delta-60 repeat protein
MRGSFVFAFISVISAVTRLALLNADATRRWYDSIHFQWRFFLERTEMKKQTVWRRFCIDLLETRVLLSGDLDPTFGTGGLVQGASSSVTSYGGAVGAVQSDGKLLALAISNFESSDPQQLTAFRFLPDGAVDQSFGTNGSVVLDDNSGGALFIAEAANGNIFAAETTRVFELSSSGVVSLSFGAGMTFSDANMPTAMITDGNDLLLATGDQIQEFDQTGALVSTFGTDGTLNLSGGVSGMLLTPQGEIAAMVGGTVTSTGTVEEFNSDGSANSAFVQSSQVVMDGALNQLLPQSGPNGQIYVATVVSSTAATTITRLTTTGAVDSTFSPFTTTLGPYAVESDGSVLITQSSNPTTFTDYSATGVAGTTSSSFNLDPQQLLPLAGGNYIAFSSSLTASAYSSSVGTAEFTSANVPEDSFGTGGVLTAADLTTTPSAYSSVAVQSDRKVITGGLVDGPDGQAMILTRYNVDGSLDTTFGTGGSVEESFGDLQAQSISLLIEPDGNIAAAGNLENPLISTTVTAMGVAEFSSTGALVTGFGIGGEVTFQGDENPSLMWQDGDLLVGSTNTVRRLTSTGMLDSTFPTTLHGGLAFAVQSDEKILVLAETSSTNSNNDTTGVYRYNENGTPDTTFGTNGLAAGQSEDGLDSQKLIVESNGTIVLLGSTGDGHVSYLQLAGLNSNGSADTSFGTDGTFDDESNSGDANSIVSLIPETDGDFLVTFNTTASVRSSTANFVEQHLPDGQLDTSFASAGLATFGTGGAVGALDSAGRLVLAGDGLDLYAVNTTGGGSPGPGTSLVFLGQPQASGNGTLSNVNVLVEDADGAIATTDSSTVTLSLPAGTTGATLGGTTTAAPVNGLATFAATISAAGTGYTLTATDGSLAPATSVAFNVASVPTLVFATTPAYATVEEPFSVVVDIHNADGSLASTDDSQVSLNDSSGTLNGLTSVYAVNGVATFTELFIAQAGADTLTATDGGDPAAPSPMFPVALPKLVFIPQPTNTLGALPSFTVAIEDADGNVITSDESEIDVTLSTGTLNGTTDVDAVDGIATFTGLSISSIGTGYTLIATEPGKGGATGTSSPFAVTEPLLVFTQQPADATTVGTPGPVTVAIEDPSGNVITTDDSQVRLSLAARTAGATLGGTAAVTAVNGIAIFTDLSVTTPGEEYTLIAADGVDVGGSSSAFDITTPSQLAIAQTKVILPATNIAGQKLNARVPVIITNAGTRLNQRVFVVVYADTTDRLDGKQVRLESIDPRLVMNTGRKVSYDFLIRTLPASLPAGQYYMLSELVDAGGGTSLAVSTQTVTVIAPVVEPVVAVASAVPATIKPNGVGSVWITLTNNGNISARGVDLTLNLSTDETTALGSPLRTVKIAITVAAGRSVRFRLALRIPRASAAGAYVLIASTTLDGVSAALAVGSGVLTIS